MGGSTRTLCRSACPDATGSAVIPNESGPGFPGPLVDVTVEF